LNVETLGGLSVKFGAKRFEGFRRKKTGELLVLLALSPGKPFTRAYLASVLWPDDEETPSRLRLNQCVWEIRTLFGDEILDSRRETLALREQAVTLDLLDLAKQIAQARDVSDPSDKRRHLANALGLYRGEFMPTYDSEWVEDQRRRVEEEFRATALDLAALHLKLGEPQKADEIALRLVRDDPYEEAGYCLRMSALMAQSRPMEALDVWKELQTVTAELGDKVSSLADGLRQKAERMTMDLAPSPSSEPTKKREEARDPRQVPTPLTRFFGREEELGRIQALLDDFDNRLITLTGPGGSGKTRLATEIAQRVQDSGKAKVVFVPLVDAREASEIANRILESLRRTIGPARDPLQEVAEILGEQQANRWLLVFDNVEHIAQGAASILQRLLGIAKNASCLLTSRQRLGLQGEAEVPILPLSVPDYGSYRSELRAEWALKSPSIALFADRARLSNPQFTINESNVRTVLLLCHRLEGVPLALEIAASWIHVLSPEQLYNQLARQFELESRNLDIPDRHRSLGAVLESSLASLWPKLRTAFCRLAVFRGGFTASSAFAVVGGESTGIGEHEIVGSLALLRERSLVFAESSLSDSGDPRMRMLESVRDFALGQLSEEERALVERRHAEYFAKIVESRSLAYGEDRFWTLSATVEQEMPNIEAALEWARRNGELEFGIELCERLRSYWMVKGQHFRMQQWADTFLGELGNDDKPALFAECYFLSGLAAMAMDQLHRGLELVHRAIPPFRASGMPIREAMCRSSASVATFLLGDLAGAEDEINESLRLSQEVGYGRGVAIGLQNLGEIANRNGEPERAIEIYQRAAAAFVEQNDWTGAGQCHLSLFELYRQINDDDRARSALRRCIEFATRARNTVLLGSANRIMGEFALEDNDWPSARQYFRSFIEGRVPYSTVLEVNQTLANAGRYFLSQGRPSEAARLFAYRSLIRQESLDYHRESELLEALLIENGASLDTYRELEATLAGLDREQIIDRALAEIVGIEPLDPASITG
jgi:predicted ATPase/DNA-binding SARP family transcriptional activator